ncbi:Photosynthetic reaction center subunit H [Sphingomonas antarctica]|uniref:photosynthetic reaction center subunit H n=1 Tax=Sphingomonas antarctica TaxID=2040274 RepID=UPI0039E9E415
MHPQLTPSIDVALLVFWAFVLFFIGLVFYLRREDRREGYPLEDEVSGRVETAGGPMHTSASKSFRLPFDRGMVSTPTKGREPVDIAARRMERSSGSPYVPTGDPFTDGIGPAAWAERAKHADLDMDGHPRIVPLSSAPDYSIAREDAGVTGWPLIGADGEVAGTVTDLWIDKADRLVRYIQFASEGGPALAPIMMAKVDRRKRQITIDALRASQFAGVPRLGAIDQITLYEEERVQAYFGGGYLYATPDRQEPIL